MSRTLDTAAIAQWLRPTRVAGLALLTTHFAVHALARPRPRPISVEERLSMLPRDRIPLDARVVIHWSEHQIPFIEAETDKDLATALGVVHAHLRIAQMEMLRCLSQGRVSELIGPIAIDLDHLLRILDFGRAVPAILEDLPLETRQWLDAFVAGINHHLDHARVLPFEIDVLKLHRKRWSVSDVLRIGRLVAADANWIVWFQLLRLRRRKDWPRLWCRLTQSAEAARPDPVSSRCDGCQLRFLELILGRASNSVAVSKARSTSGSALMANDPHLGVHLPGPWMIAGYKSPSHQAIGLMAPGLPFVAIGRNPWIAWGGTNLHAASSDFYDVSDLPAREITDRQENIGVRWWPDRQVTIRETTVGPVISDARLLGMGRCKPVAMRWMAL